MTEYHWFKYTNLFFPSSSFLWWGKKEKGNITVYSGSKENSTGPGDGAHRALTLLRVLSACVLSLQVVRDTRIR